MADRLAWRTSRPTLERRLSNMSAGSTTGKQTPPSDIPVADLVDRLQSSSHVTRNTAVDALRLALARDKEEFLEEVNIPRLLQVIPKRLKDPSWHSVSLTMKLVLELLPVLGIHLSSSLHSVCPVIVEKMGDTRGDIRKLALDCITLYIALLRNKQSVVDVMLQVGLTSDNIPVRVENVNGIVTVIQKERRGEWDFHRILSSLAACLSSTDRNESVQGAVQKAMSTMIKEYPVAYETAIQSLTQRERDVLSSNVLGEALLPANIQGTTASLRTRGKSGSLAPVNEGRELYGYLPAKLATDLQDVGNWRVRTVAIEEMSRLTSALVEVRPLIPHLSDLIRFVCGLLEDHNFKICLTSLEITRSLVLKFGMLIEPYIDTILSKLVDKWQNNMVLIRQASSKTVASLLRVVDDPRSVVQRVLQLATDHSNWHVREESVASLIQAMLLYHRPEALHYQSMLDHILHALNDNRPKVKYVALEAMAVFWHRMGSSRAKALIDSHSSQLFKTNNELYQRIMERVKLRHLPRLGTDGLIDFNNTTSNSADAVSTTAAGAAGAGVDGENGHSNGNVPDSAGGSRSSSSRASSRGPGTARMLKALPWETNLPNSRVRARSAPRRLQQQDGEAAGDAETSPVRMTQSRRANTLAQSAGPPGSYAAQFAASQQQRAAAASEDSERRVKFADPRSTTGKTLLSRVNVAAANRSPSKEATPAAWGAGDSAGTASNATSATTSASAASTDAHSIPVPEPSASSPLQGRRTFQPIPSPIPAPPSRTFAAASSGVASPPSPNASSLDRALFAEIAGSQETRGSSEVGMSGASPLPPAKKRAPSVPVTASSMPPFLQTKGADVTVSQEMPGVTHGRRSVGGTRSGSDSDVVPGVTGGLSKSYAGPFAGGGAGAAVSSSLPNSPVADLHELSEQPLDMASSLKSIKKKMASPMMSPKDTGNRFPGSPGTPSSNASEELRHAVANVALKSLHAGDDTLAAPAATVKGGGVTSTPDPHAHMTQSRLSEPVEEDAPNFDPEDYEAVFGLKKRTNLTEDTPIAPRRKATFDYGGDVGASTGSEGGPPVNSSVSVTDSTESRRPPRSRTAPQNQRKRVARVKKEAAEEDSVSSSVETSSSVSASEAAAATAATERMRAKSTQAPGPRRSLMSSAVNPHNVELEADASGLQPITGPGGPDRVLRTSIEQLSSPEWTVVLDAFLLLRRIFKHHSDVIGKDLHAIVLGVRALVDSPRSSVSKAAVIVMQDAIRFLKKMLDTEVDPIVSILLKKSGEANHFIAQEAEKGLSYLCEHLSDRAVISALMNFSSHKNPSVRQRVAYFLDFIIELQGAKIYNIRDCERICANIIQFLSDGSQEARHLAKRGVYLMNKFGDEEQFKRVFAPLCSSVTLQRLLDIVRDAPAHQNYRFKLGGSVRPMQSRPKGSTVAASASSSSLLGGNTGSGGGGSGGPTPLSARGGSNVPPDVLQALQNAGPSSSQFSSMKVAGTAQNRPSRDGRRERSSSGGSRSASSSRKSAAVSGPALNEADSEELSKIYIALNSNEWRSRHQSLESLLTFLKKRHKNLDATRVAEVFDHFLPRLSDVNTKVNMQSLNCLKDIIEVLKGQLEPALVRLIPSLASCLASTNTSIRTAATDVLDYMVRDRAVDAAQLLEPFVHVVQYGNMRVRPAIMEKMVDLIDVIGKKRVILKILFPVCVRLLSQQTARELKKANESVLQRIGGLFSVDKLVETMEQPPLQVKDDVVAQVKAILDS